MPFDVTMTTARQPGGSEAVQSGVATEDLARQLCEKVVVEGAWVEGGTRFHCPNNINDAQYTEV